MTPLALGYRSAVQTDHAEKISSYGHDLSQWTKVVHDTLREWLRQRKKALCGNLRQESRQDESVVSNHPIYYYKARFTERSDDIYCVDVSCETKSADDAPVDKDAPTWTYEPRVDTWEYHLRYDLYGHITSTDTDWDSGVWYPTNLYHPVDLGPNWEPYSNPRVFEWRIQDIADVPVGGLRRSDP